MNTAPNRLLPLGLAALMTIASPALAQQDPFDDPVQADVLQGWDLPDGRRLAAVRLTLDPGWKTYWRAPGDAGIPPHFDWSRARNLSAVSISWPTPHVYEDNGMQSIGYKGQVVIPMYLTPDNPAKPVRLRTKMSLGVCADVCMPHQIDIDTMLDAPDLSPTPAIVAALADTPYASDEAGVTSATCRLSPTENGMRIEARVTLPHTGGREVAVIETGTKGLWISEARTTRSGDTVTAISDMVHMEGGAFGIDRSAVRITIFGGDYAVDVQGCTAG
ncbi:protein-disulfide reductase DsbD domain-containing protein [uncultured Tateyamaria sp.]|uniref:protein-disulfide reductase DsbD domain-containing protein n=1 Tax=uncultured Tateyamaria sp. TaxID=455651 RepID=UPI002614C4A7|nr:protein-disulfide reductase DsbD domain-containing protein [uncultured Tateyamaria sp.]